MEKKNPLDDMFILGIENETYEQLLAIAKKQGKSVTEVTSEALRNKIAQETNVSESKKLLMEG